MVAYVVLGVAGAWVLAVIVACVVDAVRNVRESRRRGPAMRRAIDAGVVPILPWPGDRQRQVARGHGVFTSKRESVGASKRDLARSERGAGDGDLMAGLAFACILVVFFAGSCLQTIGDAVTGAASDAWDAVTPERDRPAASRVTAAALRADLRRVEVVEELREAPGYSREAFGSDWADRGGCDTRNRVLARDLAHARRDGDGCTVLSGTLRDPYTGERIRFDREADPSAIQADHIFPLALAWDAGASEWTEADRVAFANDARRNLLAVDGPTNASKGDSPPAEWMPPRDAYACTYLHKYLRVAAAYDLTVTTADAAVVRKTAPQCRTARGGGH